RSQHQPCTHSETARQSVGIRLAQSYVTKSVTDMRKAPVVGIAMLLLATGVHAQILLPPAEYDYPYIDGPIVVTRLQTRSEVDAVCQKKALACARRTWSNVCEIYVLGNEIALGQYGATIALLLRHEIAHYNGWGGDHAGGRTLSHSGIQKLNEMPPARVWPLVD